MNVSNFDSRILKAGKYFIYLALLVLIIILVFSGAFSRKEVSSDHIHSVQDYDYD